MRLWWFLLAFSLLFTILYNLGPVRTLHDRTLEELKRRENRLEYRVEALRMSEAPEELAQRKRELVATRFLFVSRQLYLDKLFTLLFFVAVIMLVADRLKQRLAQSAQSQHVSGARVKVDPPGEEYVDEWELHKRIEGSFVSKDDAIRWLLDDPAQSCYYCSGVMKATDQSRPQSVRLMTFYKKVPDGAKDLRVVLGTHWFALPATELRCESCGKIEKR